MQSEWWRGAIIYQIYPRSFYDSNRDGTGDLSGIRAKLDYVASLGVDAIWISPFFKSPMRDFGYDVSDYRKVDPIFGSNADFNALVEAAHERGLKVIIDMVLAHTSDQHAWFQESRQNRTNSKADWYVWADPNPDGTPPNNWISVFGGIEFWPDFKGRDGCRTPMPWSSFSPNGGFSEVRPWLPMSPEHLRLAVDQQEKDPDSVLHMFRRFVAWRKGQPALVRGAIRLLPSDGTILAFERSLDRDCILCIFNFSNHEAIQELEAEWQPIAEAGFRSSLDSGRVYLHPFGAWFGAARLSHG